jgi:hypothetical protein
VTANRPFVVRRIEILSRQGQYPTKTLNNTIPE